jgi:uncharacterized protein
MSISANKELVLRYMRHVEQGQLEEALALAVDDARFWHPLSGDSDKAAVRAAYGRVAPLLKSFRSDIRNVIAEEDRVAVEAEVDMDLSNGKHYHNYYSFFFVVRDGRIRNSREYVDSKAFEAAFAATGDEHA